MIIQGAFLLFVLTASCAFAGGTADDDYATLRNLLSQHTYELSDDAYVYNWHHADSEAELSRTSTNPRDYAGVQAVAARYWDKQTDPSNNRDMYGTGLYVAVDPVFSRSYGQDGSWVLTQIKLPAGFRVMDIERDEALSLPRGRGDLVTRLGCPASWKDHPLLDDLLNPVNYQGFPKCAAMVRKLLKDDLKIDGFAYSDAAQDFAECDSGSKPYGNKPSLVITNADKLQPSSVRVFSRLTADDHADRARIQGLFAKAQKIGLTASPELYAAQLAAAMKASGQGEFLSWINSVKEQVSAVVNGENVLTTTLCDPSLPSHCIQVKWAPPIHSDRAPPDPGTLRAADVKKGNFLWTDLEGAPFPKALKPWMQRNLFECKGGAHYRTASPAVKDTPKAREVPEEPESGANPGSNSAE